ncbi:MAG: aspartate kinase, partial [Flavobacteriaceae bacterium]|nr:aspartate kinase [Flavobacteriaceae bacterium]
MIVLKFGGTSVGSVENFYKIASIVNNIGGRKIVVLSAMSGVTNTLQKIANLLYLNHKKETKLEIEALNNKYLLVIQDLFKKDLNKTIANKIIGSHNDLLLSFLDYSSLENNEKEILVQGEMVTTKLFQLLLEELGQNSNLIPAINFMKIDGLGEPQLDYIESELSKIINKKTNINTFITQGFVCKNDKNNIDNLKRGGSDYTASLIGAALKVEQIQIWTDIDGMHNNDPRFVDQTFSIEEISFDEAAELAYFGAKILHPQSIIPAKEKNIPVLVKNTFKPEAKGTLIHDRAKTKDIRAIAAKDNITAIKIKSYRMLMAYGFLKKVFEIFEQNKTSIDMITTSEVAISLTIDDVKKLDKIILELQGFGNIKVDSDLSIICIAGDLAQNKKGVTSAIFNCLRDIPIRMISYGGSNYNLSFLVKTTDKVAVLNLLN